MVACAVGFGLVYVVADRTGRGQFVDELVFLVLYGLVPTGWPVDGLAFVARDVVIVVLAAAAALLAGVALIQGRRLPVVRVVAVTAVAVVSTPWLRDEVLRRQSFEPEAFPLNSMPSTHASAAAALVRDRGAALAAVADRGGSPKPPVSSWGWSRSATSSGRPTGRATWPPRSCSSSVSPPAPTP